MSTPEQVRADLALLGGLATVADLAKRWDVTVQRAWNMSKQAGFPAPLETIGGTKLYVVAEAEAYRNRDRPASMARAK